MRIGDPLLHGNYRIERRNHIIVARLIGGWNEDTARAYSRDFKLEAEPLMSENWGHLVYLDEWEMGVPGVEDIITSLVAWCVSHKLTHTAHVFNVKSIVRQYTDSIVDCGRQCLDKQVFNSDRTALDWLASHGLYS